MGLVVGDSVLPATEDDADPLVGQGAFGHAGSFSFGELGLVVGVGPATSFDGDAGEFVERLAEELAAGPSRADESALAALGGQGRDTGGGGQLLGAGETLPVVSQCGEDTGVGFRAAGQGLEEGVIGVFANERGDLSLVSADRLVQGKELGDEGLRVAGAGAQQTGSLERGVAPKRTSSRSSIFLLDPSP